MEKKYKLVEPTKSERKDIHIGCDKCIALKNTKLCAKLPLKCASSPYSYFIEVTE